MCHFGADFVGFGWLQFGCSGFNNSRIILFSLFLLLFCFFILFFSLSEISINIICKILLCFVLFFIFRYIEVFRSSFREFSRVNLDADGPPPQPYSYGPPMQNYGGPPPHIQGLYGSRMPPPMMDYGPPPMDRYGWQDDPYQRGVGSRPPPPGPYGGNDYHDQGPEWDKPGPMRSRFPKPHKGPYPDMGKFRSRNGGRMNDQRPPLQQPNQGCPPGPPPSSYNHFIYMRGVPFHFVETDIMDFFSDFTTPIGVNIIYNDYGRPSGEAKVEFRTHNDALNAMKKDRSYLSMYNLYYSKL